MKSKYDTAKVTSEDYIILSVIRDQCYWARERGEGVTLNPLNEKETRVLHDAVYKAMLKYMKKSDKREKKKERNGEYRTSNDIRYTQLGGGAMYFTDEED